MEVVTQPGGCVACEESSVQTAVQLEEYDYQILDKSSKRNEEVADTLSRLREVRSAGAQLEGNSSLGQDMAETEAVVRVKDQAMTAGLLVHPSRRQAQPTRAQDTKQLIEQPATARRHFPGPGVTRRQSRAASECSVRPGAVGDACRRRRIRRGRSALAAPTARSPTTGVLLRRPAASAVITDRGRDAARTPVPVAADVPEGGNTFNGTGSPAGPLIEVLGFQVPASQPASQTAEQQRSSRAAAVQPSSSSPAEQQQSSRAAAVQPSSSSPAEQQQSSRAAAVQPSSSGPAEQQKSSRAAAVQPSSSSPAEQQQSSRAAAVQLSSSGSAAAAAAVPASSSGPAGSSPPALQQQRSNQPALQQQQSSQPALQQQQQQ
ncbi:putative protein TPRXL [Schistocerca piceifrons]|uniref:putative protein TPRXL n=1 Tax=Schistocerca piceifrons TaxID=274613 RepID=UPI001F5E50A4|nr:putative protein TPRXL [Schistocerca piceifrons]